jgi:hypothetical protein
MDVAVRRPGGRAMQEQLPRMPGIIHSPDSLRDLRLQRIWIYNLSVYEGNRIKVAVSKLEK